MQAAIPAATSTQSVIEATPQKEYIRQWMHQMRTPVKNTFPRYTQKFQCKCEHDDWVARLELGYPGEVEYSLEIRLIDNDEDFVITASNMMDCRLLFSEIGLDGEADIAWIHRNLNLAMDILTRHYFR